MHRLYRPAPTEYADDATVRGRNHPCTFQRRHVILFAMSKGKAANQKKSEVLQGTLDLMILKTLQALGPLHGFGIARRLEQLSEEVLQLNEGTVYTSLLRLPQEGWIVSDWATSENNPKTTFYYTTKPGLTHPPIYTPQAH